MRRVRLSVHVILLGLVAAQLADAATFRFAVAAFGIGGEANAFAQTVFRIAGPDAVLAMKGLAIVGAVLFLAAVAGRFPRLIVLGGATGTSLGLLGAATNVLALIRFGAAVG
jgi:hypothetical protein